MDCEKTKYASQKMADEDIARIRKKSTRNTVPIRSYQCKKCGGSPWHITSKEDMFKYSEKEMENKKIVELTEQLKKHREEISMLKDSTHREITKEIKTDAKVVALNETIRKLEKAIINSRKDNSELIVRIIQLERQIAKNQA